ncbi:hypothetical protein MLD38_003341 [Melastoma candidum]|uniref:Uncharacterized protein n=1 Tax=Melastoma candidum TaxID=119954 RepID=A0ACB9SAT8_9MYRT|nr:hypothetical protein MLD38_003341 [Melastoma candidum]
MIEFLLPAAVRPTETEQIGSAYLLSISLRMDWQGQKLSEQLMQIMLVAVAVAAYVTGFMIESFRIMMLIYAGGVVLITLITVPNWPLFNRHPLKWLEPSVAEEYSKEPPQQQATAASSGKKKSTKK